MKKPTLAWISCALLFLPFGLITLFRAVFSSPPWTTLYTGYIMVSLITFGVLFLFLRLNKMSLRDIGFKGFTWSACGWGLLFFGIACVWCTGIAMILKYGFGLTKDWIAAIRFTEPYHPLLMLLAVVIVGPVTEEAVFRGFFLTMTKNYLRPWLAGLISALIIGAYYYYLTGPTGALLVFFWTPLPIILFYWKKNLYPGIALHMVNNLFPYVVVRLLANLAVIQYLIKIGVL